MMLTERDAEFVRRYHAGVAQLWIIRVMTAAALFVILCKIGGIA